jgi:hypothetical protein
MMRPCPPAMDTREDFFIVFKQANAFPCFENQIVQDVIRDTEMTRHMNMGQWRHNVFDPSTS